MILNLLAIRLLYKLVRVAPAGYGGALDGPFALRSREIKKSPAFNQQVLSAA